MVVNVNNLPVNSECLGVVLAGGLSSRMGQNKANLAHFNQQEEMLSFSKNLLKLAGVSNVIVSGDNYDVADRYAKLGPLAGIYSVIQACQPKSLLILPVDLPLITSDLLQQLKLKGELSKKATFFHDNFLPLYLPNNAYSDLFFEQAFLNIDTNKGPSIKKFIAAIPHQVLTVSNKNALFNCNTPEQWQTAKDLFANTRM